MALGLDRLALVTISLCTAIMSVVVYHRAPDRVWNRLFSVHAIGVSLWVICNYLIQAAATPAEAGIWIRLSHPIVSLVICTNVELFWAFPDKVYFPALKYRIVLYGIGFLFSLVALAPNLFRTIELAQGTVIVDYGWPFQAFGFFTVLLLGAADVILIHKMPRLTGLERVQVTYVLIGMIISQLTAVWTMVILPLAWGNTLYSRWGSAGYIFMIAFLAYVIAKHQIVRPITAVYRVSALLLTVFGVVFVAGIVYLLLAPTITAVHVSGVWYLIAGSAFGLLAVPIHRCIRSTLNRMVPNYLGDDVAVNMSHSILGQLDADRLPDFLTKQLAAMLRPIFVAVYVKADSNAYIRRSIALGDLNADCSRVPDELPAASLAVDFVRTHRELLDRTQIRRFHSLHEAEQLLVELKRFSAEIVVPVVWEKELMAIVIIAKKVSGDMYTPDEFNMLEGVLPQVALAVRNAQLFNQTLQMKEYNENLLREMKSGVISVDADRTVTMVNPAAESILGVNAESLIAQKLHVLPDMLAQSLRQALDDNSMRPPEYRFNITRPDGRVVPISCSTSGVRLERGSAHGQGAMAVLSDLTLLQELEKERQDAEHLAMIRVLSAGMAHEIRNPLVAIRTFAELLPMRWEDEEFRNDFLSTAQAEISRIDGLLADLLMLSKPADAVVEPIDVERVCTAVARAMSANAEAAGVTLETELCVKGKRPTGDESRLHQALLNLVANAVDAEPLEGYVRIAARQCELENGQSVMYICVHNSNSYIPDEQKEEIFKPFYSRRAGGTGLGLAISQTIVEEHDGTIKVTSEPGKGTDFIIQLPLKAENGET